MDEIELINRIKKARDKYTSLVSSIEVLLTPSPSPAVYECVNVQDGLLVHFLKKKVCVLENRLLKQSTCFKASSKCAQAVILNLRNEISRVRSAWNTEKRTLMEELNECKDLLLKSQNDLMLQRTELSLAINKLAKLNRESLSIAMSTRSSQDEIIG